MLCEKLHRTLILRPRLSSWRSHSKLERRMVEVRGIEPRSGEGRKKASPITVLFRFSHIYRNKTKNKYAR